VPHFRLRQLLVHADVKKIHRIPDGGGTASLRAVDFVAAHGISRMERLMIDNASVCRLSFLRTLCLVSQAVGHLLPNLIIGYLAGHANPSEVLRDVWWALRANDC
jgi:hypothetical protein